ncbi:MAG: SDR family oxidoreductase, partial [Pseudomonadota bacterium]
MNNFEPTHWALVLGGSSGFGLSAAKKLAQHGMNVAIVHRDRRGAMKRIQPHFDEIEALGHGFLTLNADALSDDGRAKVLETLRERMGEGHGVRVLLHSIAFGNLKPIAPVAGDGGVSNALDRLSDKLNVSRDALESAVDELLEDGVHPLHTLTSSAFGDALIEAEDMARTIHSMGTSLLSYVQDLFKASLFCDDARVLGLTSEGNEVAWRGYAAVAAAKVALESVSRAVALEYGPYGIRSNIIQAGVGVTPA